ncbi:MAG: hypothetical protein ACP5RD_04225 [bacterium]
MLLFNIDIDKDKNLITFHRFGKIIKFNKLYFIIQFIILNMIFLFYFINYSSKVNDFFITLFSKFLKNPIIDNFIFFPNLFNKNIKYLITEASYPSYEFTLYNLIFVIIFILILNIKWVKNKLNLAIRSYLIFTLIPLIFSCFYFLFFSNYFPYDIKTFSIIYLKLQLGLFIFISIITSFIISFFNFSFRLFILNLIIFIFILIYSIFFGYLRYLIFLLIINKYSFLYMSFLFFNFGPFIDFIYLTFFYGLYLSFINNLFKENKYYKFIQ